MPWGSVNTSGESSCSLCRSGRALLLGLFFLFSISLPSAEACTLWGATGDSVENRGTIVVKNRDWTPDHRQELRVLRPKGGYASLVLVAVGGTEQGVKAGMNEKGLVIVSATAGQLSRDERSRFRQRPGLLRTLLAECATVDDILKRLEQFRRPVFYLVGDQSAIATIEVAPDGRVHVERRTSGTLSHSNHYRAADVRGIERLPSASSLARLQRIELLLKEQNHPFSLTDFIRFSEDKKDGPDNGILRTGSTPAKTRTLATWIGLIPSKGSPELYIKILDPGQQERVCRLSLDSVLLSAQERLSLESVVCSGAVK